MEKCVSKARQRSYLFVGIAIALLSVGLTFSIFWPVCIRFFKALTEDFFQSVVYFGGVYVALFTGKRGATNVPSIAEVPKGIEEILPFRWEDFAAKCGRFWSAFFDGNNFTRWFSRFLSGAVFFLMMAIVVCLVVVLLVRVIILLYKKGNNDYGRKSKPLWLCLQIEKWIYSPIKRYVKGFWEYCRDSQWIKPALGIVWAINLNLFTVALEVAAWFLYFCFSIDFRSLWTLVVRLVYDISVPIRVIPWWLTLFIAYKVFDKTRKKIAVSVMRMHESSNVEFLRTYLGALFLVGKQRAKKTTIITDMALSQEVIFREDAFELLKKRDKQFPHVPWQEVENFYWNTQKILPTMASHREFLVRLRHYFEWRHSYEKFPNLKKLALDRLRKLYGYEGNDFCFGYDADTYGETYNDNLTVTHVFDAIEGYIQLFYVYAAPSPLIFGNYSIRTDLRWQDSGNFPLLDGDFFDRPAEEQDKTSQYCHVAKLDCFRLGSVFDADDPYINGFEVGILNMMEAGKERGNQKTNEGVKSTDATVNAKNDGFELDIKMRAHGSTIDNYTFFRLFMDEQRADSLSSDNKDLTSIILIKEVSDAKVLLPFTFLEKWLYSLATKIYEKVYYTLRNLRGDAEGTLFVHLLKKLYSPIFRHWDRIQKEYSVHVARLKVTDAMQDKVLSGGAKYYIAPKKTYSNRFATDAIKHFYHAKAKKSRYGLNDFPMYEGKHMTVKEMEESGSIFYRKIINAFHNNEAQRERLDRIRAKKAK